MHNVPAKTIDFTPPSEPAYTVSSKDTGSLILGIPGAMACSFATMMLILVSSGGFAGIAWILSITMWVGYLTAMAALWAYDA
jgi:hypothetical protein